MFDKFEEIVKCIRSLYPDLGFIPLHEPKFSGNEKNYVNKCIDSTFVSSVGEYVDRFEKMITDYTGSCFAVATVNGTTALYLALLLGGVHPGDEVLTQALTFVATANSISYIGAIPHFIDVDRYTLSMSPDCLKSFLERKCIKKSDGFTYSTSSGNRIAACVPMHTFGHPARINEIAEICMEHGIFLVEDAAESVGSFYKDKHTGRFGNIGIFSFNGNKIVTCGGGGMIVTDDEDLAKFAKHMTTQAKMPHKWAFNHDMIGFNFRLPNLNAALACAQMESINHFVDNKRETALEYKKMFENIGVEFVNEPINAKSNFWLNAIIMENKKDRDAFLEYSNIQNVMTRPAWKLACDLVMYKDCPQEELSVSKWIEDRLVNIPSSVRMTVGD